MLATIRLLLLLLITVVPLINIQADPPYTLNHSIYTDEGIHVYAARNKALFGTWELPEEKMGFPRSHWVLSSLGMFFLLPHTIMNFFVFSLFGTGLLQARLLSAAEGIMAIWLLYGLVKRSRGHLQAFAAAALWGTSLLYLVYVRSGQTYGLLFLTGVFVLVCADKVRSNIGGALLAGLMCFLITVTHLSSIYIIVVLFATFLFWQWEHSGEVHTGNRDGMRLVAACLSGFSLPLILWYAAYIKPNFPLLNAHYRHISPQDICLSFRELPVVLLGRFRESNYMWTFENIPVVAYLGFVAAVLYLGIGTVRLGGKFIELFSAFWLILGTALVMIHGATQIRYFSILTLPASVLSGWFLFNVQRVRDAWGNLPSLRKSLIACVLILLNVVWAAHYLQKWHGYKFSISAIPLANVGIPLVLGVLATMISAYVVVRKRWLEGVGARIVLFAVLSFCLVNYSKHLFRATWFTHTNNRALQQMLGPNDTVEGFLAATLGLDSKAKSLYVFDPQEPREIFCEETVKKMGITHLILSDRRLEEYNKAMPEVMQRAKLVRTMVFRPLPSMREQKILLFALLPQGGTEKVRL